MEIRIREYFTFYAPTAFTPNYDGDNDCFGVCGEGIDPNAFSLIVFDRWGSIVFETDTYDADLGCSGCGDSVWDGSKQGNVTKGDRLLDTGIYPWICIYKDQFGIEHKYNGLVSLIR
jgi:gliding motility-associated-like protein